ncbi:hypothetical protein O3M35_011187 [Rhynocoris fuscipes]|uniref:15-hydroxyprostaglandin dehydrogenase [NAD(+)] n=1 Tax=Rhynocoris fuscipes TaxID=488301 RepID=A0AAW1CXY4_9HEMI
MKRTISTLSTIRGTMIGTEIMSKQKLRPGGVIINVASAFAFDNYPSAPVFVSENNGIIGFSKSWGATPNYTNTKVRCVVICPAAIDGIDLRNSLGISAGEPGKDSQNTSSTRSTSTSVGRGIVYCVQHASSGTVWFVEGTGLFKAHIPDRLEYSQKIRYV